MHLTVPYVSKMTHALLVYSNGYERLCSGHTVLEGALRLFFRSNFDADFSLAL